MNDFSNKLNTIHSRLLLWKSPLEKEEAELIDTFKF